MVDMIAKNLQVLRSDLSSGAFLKITSAVRAAEDFERLVKLGYRPSETSDHNFGYSVPLKTNQIKKIKYGSTYNFSVGAADVVPVNIGARDFFEMAVDYTKSGKCQFGQVIYEFTPETKTRAAKEWVHFGNDPSFFFGPEIVKLLNRAQFLETLNGGKSYQVVHI